MANLPKMVGRFIGPQRRSFFLFGVVSLTFFFGLFRQHSQIVKNGRNAGCIDLTAPQLKSPNVNESENALPPSASTAIYSRLRQDQAGWVIFDMLKAHSYAFSRNVTYGGACGPSIHKDDIQKVLTAVGWQDILPLRCPSKDTTTKIYSGSIFQKGSGRRMGSKSWRTFIQNHTNYSHFESSSDKAKGDGRVESSALGDTNSRPFTVVVHIRRRDVTPCCYPQWYLPNSYFTSMIEKHRSEHKQETVRVEIFSQSDAYEPWSDFVNNTNYTMHLDGPVGEVWTAILSADVFIGSISEFSRVPSLFTKARIVDPHNISDPTIANQTRTKSQQLLEQCPDYQLFQCKHKWFLKQPKK